MAEYYKLGHLPRRKRAQLQEIVRLLCEKMTVEMVILFGSYAHGDWVEDREGGHISDFDLLVIVESPSLVDNDRWPEIREEARSHTDDTPVSFIVHDIEDVNARLAQGVEFFQEIKEDGIVL